MKTVVSVSLGDSSRDHSVEMTLLGTKIRIDRRGTDGDKGRFVQLLKELDGQVDAFGIGGADLAVDIGDKHYSLHSVQKLVKGIKTPFTDGAVLRQKVESQIAQWLSTHHPQLPADKTVLVGSAAARYSLAKSFSAAGYSLTIADLAFAFGLPLAFNSLGSFEHASRFAMPIVSHVPIEILYPTGAKQTKNTPKYGKWFDAASIIADDFHYLKQFLPLDLSGKTIITNTTTAHDVEWLRSRNAAYLCTTTRRFDGRSFGTNVMEACLIAIAGKNRVLNLSELSAVVADSELFSPEISKL